MTTKEILIIPEDLKRFNLSQCSFEKLTPFLIQAQELELCAMLGDCLYEKLVCDTGTYSDLLNETKYDCHGNMKRHNGVKIVLAHLAYAGYALRGSNIDTPHGMVQKLNTDSIPVPAAELRSVYNEHRRMAKMYWSKVLNYLVTQKGEDKYDCFDFNKCPPCGCNTSKGTNEIRKAVKFKAIRKNEKVNYSNYCHSCNEQQCSCSKSH